jgi:hypothetical protein
MFVTQPNLGFQVILTADFLTQGPDLPITEPGKIVFAVTPSGASALGLSSEIASAPISGDVATAGLLFTGDSSAPPTILMSNASPTSRPASATPTAEPSTATSASTSSPQAERIAAAAAIDSVPEPSTAIGVSLALLGLGWMKYRSKRT